MADQKHSWSHLHARLASQSLAPVTQLKQRFVSLCVADIESHIFFFRFTWIIGKPGCKLPCHVWPGPWMTLFSLLFSQLLQIRPYCTRGVSLPECMWPCRQSLKLMLHEMSPYTVDGCMQLPWLPWLGLDMGPALSFLCLEVSRCAGHNWMLTNSSDETQEGDRKCRSGKPETCLCSLGQSCSPLWVSVLIYKVKELSWMTSQVRAKFKALDWRLI